MKVLINTITPTELADIRLQQEKDGVKPEDMFNGIYDVKGELFFSGEWKHVADNFDVSSYPFIREVNEYFPDYVIRSGVPAFAQGIKEAADLYGKNWGIEPIVIDMLKYATKTTLVGGVIK